MDIADLQFFHFLRPNWLWALIPLLIVAFLLFNRKLVSRSWQSVIDARLLPFILTGQEGHKTKWPVLVFAVTGMLIIVAMAGPAWEKLPQPVFRTQSGLVIVLDMSQSMDATDIKPSRIARAKHKITDILAKRSEGQTALVVYASEAFVVSPLSDDVKTIESLVTSLSTELMPNQGSQPLLAIKQAVELLQQGGMPKGDILLITDGLGANAENTLANSLAGKNYRLSVLAVGTAGGAPVQLSNGSLLKDRFGDIVIPKLQEESLRSLAHRTGGRYTLLTATDKDINYLTRGFEFSPIKENAEMKTEQVNLKADTWREEGPWLLLLIAPFVALAFRRGWLGAMVFCVVLPIPQTSHALSWDDLWKNQNQQAQSAFEQGQPQQAAHQFRNKKWQAAAYYKAKEYEKTLELLDASDAPEDMYNKGNALARLGRIQEAIKAYDTVLKQAPEHEDARYNKELLEKMLKQQQSKQGESDQQEQGNQQNQQQNQQSQNSQKDQEGSQQQQGGDAQQQDQSGQQQSQQAEQNKNQSSAQNRMSDDSSSDESENQQQSAMSDENSREQESENQDTQSAMQQSQEQQDSEGKADQRMAQQTENVDQAELEAMQANEQWLRRIPDDPGGLLRRKFLYQSQQSQQLNQQQTTDDEPW
ncbi:MAG: VWA domain-containing protein [Gammaproteobacteria bacterium]|nr:VWA domain-containing protein [Gammaproteobacteria bacterium]